MADRQLMLLLVLIAGNACGFLFPAAGKLLAPSLTPLVMVMIFMASLKVRLADMLADLHHPRQLIVGLILTLLAVPLLGTAVPLLLQLEPLTYIGMLLYLASPAAAATAFYAEVMHGKTALGLNISALSTLLCIVTIPAALLLFASTMVQMDTTNVILTLLKVIVIPFVAAMAVLRFAPSLTEKLKKHSFPVTFVTLFLIFFAFLGAGYEEVVSNIGTFTAVALILAGLTVIIFAVSYGVARVINADRAEAISMALGAGVKNGSIGLLVALTNFGPAAIMPMIAGSLMSAFIMLLFGKIVNRTSLSVPGISGRRPAPKSSLSA